MFVDTLIMGGISFSCYALSSIFIALSLSSSVNANGCRLCSAPQTEEIEEKIIPIKIEITTNLNFSRAALSGRGQGRIAVNERNGQKQIAGQLVDLGGYAVAGSVRITGEPGREVYIEMPNSITMRSNKGGQIDIQSLRTDLPPIPRLDFAGELRFSFGGDLIVNGDASGRFRGRIPITVNYE
jgi:hypothetical protein